MLKAIVIGLAILFIVILANRVEIGQSFDKNLNSVIGCMDYDYVYNLNVPATLTFYVSEKNNEDNLGPFKVVYAEETQGTTILHCGNEYFMVVSAAGYKDYTEKIPASPARTIMPEIHNIILEKV